MANKKVSPDGTVLRNFYATHYQDDYLNSLGPRQGSVFIRQALDDKIKNHNAELAKLKEERRTKEFELKSINAQIEELEQEANKQQDTAILIEQFLEKNTKDLIRHLENKGGNFAAVRKVIKNLEPGIEQKFNGKAQGIIEELERRVKDSYTSKGEKLYGL